MKYPKEIIKTIDELFPKGDKRRGDALVLQAVAFIEGRKIKRIFTKRLITKIFKAIDQLGDYGMSDLDDSNFSEGYDSAREGCKEVIEEILDKKVYKKMMEKQPLKRDFPLRRKAK